MKKSIVEILDELYSERIIKIRKEIDKLIWLGKTDNPKKQGILKNITE